MRIHAAATTLLGTMRRITEQVGYVRVLQIILTTTALKQGSLLNGPLDSIEI